MDLKQTQNRGQVQKLALTAQMRGSLDLLRKGQDEVAEEIEAEARRNPFLRFVPPMPASGSGTREQESVDSFRLAQPADPIRDIVQQVSLLHLTAEDRRLAEALPHCLDDRGFLSDPADQICRYLGVEPSRLARIVAQLQQSVDPPGVFAWSLADCFRIQLVARDRADSLILRLLDRLDLVARHDIAGICRHCQVDEEDAHDMLDDIRSLDPSPLCRQSAMPEVATAPELIFRTDNDHHGRAELNPAALPTLLTDDALFDTLRTTETDGPALDYYRDCYRGAGALVLAMQKRANTLLRVGQAVAQRQAKFLRTGRAQDRNPLTMGQLAQQLGLNKSTVSRALNNCFVDTEHGVLPAATFFVRPLSPSGADRTREQVLRRLSVILRTEDKSQPFSDQALVQQLAHAKLHVNRRTIAKYRALLGIPGCYKRHKTE